MKKRRADEALVSDLGIESVALARALLAADTAVIFLVFMIVVHTHRWWESPFVAVLSCLTAVLLLATCLFPADTGLKAEA